jgi:hypothetical protein
MPLHIQYPDVTEIQNIEGSGPEWDYNLSRYKPEKPWKFETEFVYGISSPGSRGEKLKTLGFEALSCMNNWWPTHGDAMRKLTFWWKINDKPIEDLAAIKVSPMYYGGTNQRSYTQYGPLSFDVRASGCGFKLSEPPISKDKHFRYFCLLRLPLTISAGRKKILNAFNYRHIATGKLAQFWLNGWEPKAYNKKAELQFFLDKGCNLNAYELPSKKITGPLPLLRNLD